MSRPRFLACACPDKMALRLSYVEPARWLGFDIIDGKHGNKLSLFNNDNNNSNNNNFMYNFCSLFKLVSPTKKKKTKKSQIIFII